MKYIHIFTTPQQQFLLTCALVGQLPHLFEHHIDDLLANGVVTAGVVVSGVLLACNQLFGVEEGAVGPRSHLVWKKGEKRGRQGGGS